MKENTLQSLIDGYREFRKEYVGKHYAEYRAWASKTQHPRTMIIGCSDSRINPAIITHAGLGELFTVNNVANLVPPYKEGKNTHHSTSAALEFALLHLKVEHVIILGHSGCGGIKALMDDSTNNANENYSFIVPWVQIAAEAKQQVKKKFPQHTKEEQTTCCEKEALLISLKNLETFPWIKEALDNKTLTTHAWYFDLNKGELEQYDAHEDTFSPLLKDENTP